MPNVTGLRKSGRGRPTLEQQKAYKESLKGSPTLFDTTPYTMTKSTTYNIPEFDIEQITDINSWLQWVYEFLLINPEVVSVLTIYENKASLGIKPPYSLLQTTQANDPDIKNLLEERIVSLVLEGKMKATFAQALLTEKYGWSGEAVSKAFDGEIKFEFA